MNWVVKSQQFIWRLLNATILYILLSATVFSQSLDVEELSEEVKSLSQTVSILIRISTPPHRTDESLASARIKFQNLLSDSKELTGKVNEEISALSVRLTEIGPAPEEGQPPEDISVTETRTKLSSERSQLAVLKTEIDELVDRANEQISKISVRRQDAFTKAIFNKTTFSNSLFSDAAQSITSVFAAGRSLFSNWFKFIWETKPWHAIGSTLLALGFAIFVRHNFTRLFGAYLYSDEENPDYFTKLFYAFWATLLPSLSIAIFLFSIYGLFIYFDIYSPKVQELCFALTLLITGTVFAWNISKAIFAPSSPNWRLVHISNSASIKMFWLIFTLLVLQGIDYVFQTASLTLAGTVEQTALQGIIASCLIGGILLWIVLIKPFEGMENSLKDANWPKWFSIPLIMIAAMIIISAFLGYIGLARFTSQQVVVSGAILAVMGMGLLAARELAKEGVLATTPLGKFLVNRMGFEEISVEQVSLGTSILFVLGILAVGLPAILLQWGTTSEEILNFAKQAFTGFDIGNIRFSISGILFGLLIFAIGVLLTRLIKRWLRRSVFPRIRADVGVRDSISSGLGYLGYGLAALFAVTAAGLDLSNLAIVAGALSLGIGFGLQNVVNNFVSGLILLIERPIKNGDWIVVGNAEGTVKRISVRATEIETFQRKSIIIPNSELINSQVGNWTFKSKSGRVDIPIGVGYDSNVETVEKILYEIAEAQPMVAKKPEPNVWFKGFGDSSLDFSLRMHLYDINNTVTVETEVRRQILSRFSKAGIEIPFPQRDVNLKNNSDTLKEKALKAPPKKQQQKKSTAT